jgi:hypothetical protein
MRDNVFHTCLQFSNIASVLRDTRRRIVQDLFDCRWRKWTKSPPPKRFVIRCAIQDQTVVIHAPLNFLGRAKNLFVGRIFFDRYVRVFEIVAHNLFYSIETFSNGIRAVNICFFRRAFFKNLCYMFFDFGGRCGQLVVRRTIVISLMTVLPMDLILVRIFVVPSRERHFAERNKTASLFKLNS